MGWEEGTRVGREGGLGEGDEGRDEQWLRKGGLRERYWRG